MNQPLLYCCLASEQPEPNLIPVLMPEHKPDKAVVLLTPEMRNRPSTLGLISELGKHCKAVETHETAAFNYSRILVDMRGIIDRHHGWTIHCNMTGGTKVMSIAVSEACRAGGATCLYVDTANRSCLHLGIEPVTEPLPPVLDVHTMFRLRGYRVESCVPVEQDLPGIRDLVLWMGRNAPSLDHAILSLNALACQGEGNSLPSWAAQEAKRNSRFGELWKRVRQSGLVGSDGRTLQHPDSRKILKGGWLERYVYHIVADLPEATGVSSVHTGTAIVSSAEVKNEIDVCFAAGNRLHLIECKARQVDQLGEEDHAGMTYKLDSLCDVLAGTFGRAMLITCGEIGPWHRRRCTDLRIAHGDASHLPQLADKITRWIAPR